MIIFAAVGKLQHHQQVVKEKRKQLRLDPLCELSALLRAVNRDTAIELAPRECYVCHCPVDDGARVVLFTTRKLLLLSVGGKLLWYDDYARVALVREEKKVHVQKRGKPVDVANGVYNDQCAFEAGSSEVASLLCAFVEKVEEMPVEDMAETAPSAHRPLRGEEGGGAAPAA
mgnify:CR=1 FL=1